MEILKEGDIKRIKKCWRCKTKFVYDLSKDMYGLCGEYVECPLCGKLNEVFIFDRKYKERG